MTSPISIITHTRNSAGTLPALLETTNWAQERVIVDMMSEDDTRAIAEGAGCRVVTTPIAPAIDPVRNKFLDLVSTEWTLVLDSDEYLAADAEDTLQVILRQYGKSANAIAIPRFNEIAGQIMRGSAWYPDQQIRLFRTGTVTWPEGHHGRPGVEGGDAKTVTLTPSDNLHIHHLNYDSLQDVLEKQLRYALTDEYGTDPGTFDFGDYIAEAYAEYNRRFDPEADGQMSQALAVIMAWDRIVRGVIHWEKLGYKPQLGQTFSLPLATIPVKREALPETNPKPKTRRPKKSLFDRLRGK